jgi:hypothetical protein
LLSNTGFTLERLMTRDLHPCSRRSKLLALALGPESGYNLYAVARRAPEFHWYYPSWLFRSGLPLRRVRQAFVRAGVNDALQLGTGWWELERWRDGPMRWTGARAEAFVLAQGGERTLKLLLCGGPPERRTAPRITIQIEAPGQTAPAILSTVASIDGWSSPSKRRCRQVK